MKSPAPQEKNGSHFELVLPVGCIKFGNKSHTFSNLPIQQESEQDWHVCFQKTSQSILGMAKLIRLSLTAAELLFP